MTVLEVRNMVKSFGTNEVLKGISLTVTEGEVLAILGPSGSGKSTLLRCCTFLETMDAGELEYFNEPAVVFKNGQPVYGDLKKIRSEFGLVFQDFNLFPHWTVLRNLMDAPLRVQKRSAQVVKDECLALLSKMNLSEKANAYPSSLSGGQQQRVAIARALALKPKMLFFDEPTSALDPELTSEILHVIRGLASEDMTMVIVTHEMAFAAEVADRAIFMDEGIVLEEGPARKLIQNPTEDRTKLFLRKLQA